MKIIKILRKLIKIMKINKILRKLIKFNENYQNFMKIFNLL